VFGLMSRADCLYSLSFTSLADLFIA
jgi:hypothetical protein